jgi:hypothetical protein
VAVDGQDRISFAESMPWAEFEWEFGTSDCYGLSLGIPDVVE